MQLAKYMKLDQKGKVLAEYIWIDGSNGLRNKTKVCSVPPPPGLFHVVLFGSGNFSTHARGYFGTGFNPTAIPQRQ